MDWGFNLESVLGNLRGVGGKTYDTMYDLFFTNRRIIAAVLVRPSDFNNIYRKLDLGKAWIGGTPRMVAAKERSLALIKSRRSDFANKSAEEILALHRLSFEIKYEDIDHVILKKGLLKKALDFTLKNPLGKKISFSIEESQITDAEELVKKVLPEKAK